MNELGNRYALAALRDKRATLASEVLYLERQIRHRKDMLRHVDATLRLLNPSVDPGAIPNKRVFQKRIKLFNFGELGRLILDALREAGEPVHVSEIVTYLLKAGGHGEGARLAVYSRVRGNLAYLVRRGKIIKTGERASARWSLGPVP